MVWETFGPSGRPAGEPGDPAVKYPRHRATCRSGPPLENAAHKAKDAPSWRTRLSCVWRGLLFATTLEVGRAGRVLNVLRDLARKRELDSPPWRAQNRVLDLSTELDRRVGLRASQRSNRPSAALQAGFRIAWTRRDTVDGSVEVAVTSMVEPLRKGCAVNGKSPPVGVVDLPSATMRRWRRDLEGDA
jgi:hypothetical protein